MNRAPLIAASFFSMGLACFAQACSATGASVPPGANGNAGTTGSAGATGVAGGAGNSGATGDAGAAATAGSAGSLGTAGSAGSSGDVGTSGAAGASGSVGTSGGAGASGSVGTSGSAGASGSVGTSGSAGASGGAGTSGGAGASGSAGTSGSAGSGGATAPEPQLITSGQNAYWKTGTLTEVPSGTVDVTVNDTSVQQSWYGMGGTFNEVGWNVLSLLSASDRDHAMKLLFDATDGARFQYGRVPMGASDYALSRYTLDETAGDTSMAQFSIARDKQSLIPYIQAALAIKSDIHLWASPWTPPTWMKSNAAMDGGNMNETATNFQALALYQARFVEEYAKLNIKIEAIHPQNEPGYETRYPSCLWTAAGMATFIGSYLGPTFASRGLSTQIYLGTMSNNDANKDGTIITTVNGNSAASQYVKGYGLQWNMLPVVASLKSRNLPILQTEHKCGNYPWNPAGFPAFNPDTAANDYAYGVESWGYIRDWIKAGVNVYSAWNMVLDSAGKNLDSMRPWPQNALLTVNTSQKTLTITPAYYVFRHVSQYVDPGAKVVATTGGDALAFKNPDGTLVTVIYNSGAARKFIVSVAGKREQFDMPANGWATVNFK